MKRIQFDKIQNNSYFFILMIISLICFIIGGLLLVFENPKINKLFMNIGFITQLLFLGRMFWFKNYVQYNKLGILIKLNTFVAKSIIFENVKKINFESNLLIINLKNNKEIKVKTKNILHEDIFKLLEIIKNNSNLK